MDFLPAIHSKHNRFPSIEMGPNDVNGPSVSGGPVYAETSEMGHHGGYGETDSYGSNQPMREVNNVAYPRDQVPIPGERDVAPSRNF